MEWRRSSLADDGATERQSGAVPGSSLEASTASFKEIVPDMNRPQHTPQVAVKWFEGALTLTGHATSPMESLFRETLPYVQTGLRQDKYRRVAERSHPREAECIGLRRSRGSPPTADGGDNRSGGPMTLPFLKAARSRLSGPGVTIRESEPEAWLRSSPRQFDDLSGPRSRIALHPLPVIKPDPCRLRNFASGLSAPASLRTDFHICSALSPTKAQSGRAAIGPFRRAALRGLLS